MTVNTVRSGGSPETLVPPFVLLIGAAAAAGLVTWAGGVRLAVLVEAVVAEIREDCVASALRLPRAQLEAAGSGDVVTRVADDVSWVSEVLPSVFPRLTIACFTVVLASIGIGALDPRFLTGFVVAAPLYLVTIRTYLRRAPLAYARERGAHSVRGQAVMDTLENRPTVAAFRQEETRLAQIAAAGWESVRWAMRTRIMQNRLFSGLNAAEALGLGTVLGISVWLAVRGDVDAGAATAAVLLFMRAVAPINALLFLMDDAQQAAAALGRIFGISVGGSDQTSRSDSREQGFGSAPGVTLTRVSAAYGGAPVLRDVTLRIAPGETVAVVGASGAGKSTLAALIAGVVQPSAGEIQRGIALDSIFMVAQERHMFSGTLRENLVLGCVRPVPDAELVSVLRRLGADQVRTELPHGLDELIGSGGAPLTASQEHLVALARVELAAPSLVILDEATAEAGSTDSATLDRAATAVTAGRMALVVAHRLTHAANADRVVVLEQGRIIEHGAPDVLLAAGGPYAQLWAAQRKSLDS